MDQHTEIFIEEAKELLGELEKGLLQLESNAKSTEAVEQVFRVMHNLKGNSNMFGFDHLGELTHYLESLYDHVREGKLTVTQDLLSLTFGGLDLLRSILADPKLESTKLKAKFDVFLAKLSRTTEALIIEKNNNDIEQDRVNDNAAHISFAQYLETQFGVNTSDGSQASYYIYFSPDATCLQNGINPFFIIDDLAQLGAVKSFAVVNSQGSFQDFDPEMCYTSWEILLSTGKSQTDIEDCFIFVSDRANVYIKKISEGNSLHQVKCLNIFENANKNNLTAAEWYRINIENQKEYDDANSAFVAETNQKLNSIRVRTDKLDDLMSLVSELVTSQARLSLIAEKSESPDLALVAENIEKLTRRLRDNTFEMSLVPIETLVVRFKRLVRDLSVQLGKKINFKTTGTDTELDKTIIEALADPLMHLMRNSLDHGIEMPEIRKKAGKTPEGNIELNAYYSGAHVVIDITDDGAGINLEKVKKIAQSKALIEEDAKLTEDEVINLIFMAGFSTADEVSGVSGRGVGMDVVKKKIEELRGEIFVTTQAGKGSKFSIRLPLTLSIIDGLQIKIGKTDFIMPLSHVSTIYDVPQKLIKGKMNDWISLEGKQTAFINLRKAFNMQPFAEENVNLITVPYENNVVALTADVVVGEYQAVLKPLGKLYKDQDMFSGATILGDGTIALVLDTNRLIRQLNTTELNTINTKNHD